MTWTRKPVMEHGHMSVYIARNQGTLYMVHTPCGEWGQWVWKSGADWKCLACGDELEFENISRDDQVFDSHNGVQGVTDWVSRWLGIPEYRLNVDIQFTDEEEEWQDCRFLHTPTK